MKNVIIHIDDIGSSKSCNKASFQLLEQGKATSGSIMVPCNGFDDAIEEYKKRKNVDLGVHLTLTSERDIGFPKWGPVSPIDEIPSLIDNNGYFYPSLDKVFEEASYEDIKKELSNQIAKALKAGIKITHIDSHMGVLLHKKTFHIYQELAELFKIQPFIVKSKKGDSLGNRFYGCDDELKSLINSGFTLLDHYDANSLYAGNDFQEHTEGRIKSIKDGTTYFIIHVLGDLVTYEDIIPDMKARRKEYEYFRSNLVDSLLIENNIHKFRISDLLL